MNTTTQGHTPGPWKAIESPSRGAYIHTSRAKIRICEVVRSPDAMANARLIAAAPEMLEALRRLTFAAANRDNTMGDPCRLLECKAELEAAGREARAAISKATLA